jgi:hypothetical protein
MTIERKERIEERRRKKRIKKDKERKIESKK